MRLLDRRRVRAVGRDGAQAVDEGAGAAEKSPSVENSGESDANPGVIFEVRVPDPSGRFERCHTTLIGSEAFNFLIRALANAEDPAARLAPLLAVAHVESPVTASTPGDERLIATSAVQTADELMRGVVAACGSAVGVTTLRDMGGACAFACTTYVSAARQADELCVDDGEQNCGGSTLSEWASDMWSRALVAGSAALELEREMRQHRGLNKSTLTDQGSNSDLILMSYPLALETVTAFSDAIDVYTELMPQREQRRAAYLDPKLALWAQTVMTMPYARFSRCLYARYNVDGAFEDVIRAADLLERHRARSLRERGIAITGTDSSRWTAAPMRTAVECLKQNHALIFIGSHPMTERIPGRWIAVGLSDDPSTRWVHETTPPTRLLEIHAWFADRMAGVASEMSTGSMPEYLELLVRLVPEEEMLARLVELWSALGLAGRTFSEIHLSAEDYALQLPWSAASLIESTADAPPGVTVVPTTALIGRPSRSDSDHTRPGRVVISTVLPAAAFEVADAVEARRSVNSEPVRVHDESDVDQMLEADVLVLLGHGQRDAGLHGFADCLDRLHQGRTPRAVILLGCWSAHLVQDLSHREVEGLAASLLGAGTEAVVASIWPVALPVGCEFVATFIEELDAGVAHSVAFATARDRLRAHAMFGHPALWAGFTLFG